MNEIKERDATPNEYPAKSAHPQNFSMRWTGNQKVICPGNFHLATFHCLYASSDPLRFSLLFLKSPVIELLTVEERPFASLLSWAGRDYIDCVLTEDFSSAKDLFDQVQGAGGRGGRNGSNVTGRQGLEFIPAFVSFSLHPPLLLPSHRKSNRLASTPAKTTPQPPCLSPILVEEGIKLVLLEPPRSWYQSC